MVPLYAVLFSLLVAPLAGAQSQWKVERFPLNKPIDEPEITVCTNSEVPARLNALLAESRIEEAQSAIRRALFAGGCAQAKGVLVYLRQMHKIEASDGTVYTVYEARTPGGALLYVPMKGYLHTEGT